MTLLGASSCATTCVPARPSRLLRQLRRRLVWNCSNPSSWRRRNADAAALRGAQGEETAGLGRKYKGNSISTTKYNVATFLPKVQRERRTALC